MVMDSQAQEEKTARKMRNQGGHFVRPGNREEAIAPISGAVGYDWELNTENCEFIAVDSQGMVTVPINDCRDGRTLLPQFQEQHQVTYIFDDAEDNDDELDVALDGLTLDESANPPKKDREVDKSTDEIWEELLLDPNHRRKMYFSHCILNETRELEVLCRSCPNDQLIDAMDEEGNTGILLAAVEEHGLNTVQWLQEHGGSISQATHYGRTPLMEAALWGRLEIVLYLTEQEIDLGIHDGNGMQAADLTADTPRNRRERKQRSGMVYREPLDADGRREQIKALLSRLQSRNSEHTQAVLETSRRPSLTESQPASSRSIDLRYS
ncbi:hypothetical protein LTR74_009073 [Friedmanniomyces endolithicus]|nr:hypothetical protein LTR74_009073 [Friedmanniomyces endolithicus]